MQKTYFAVAAGSIIAAAVTVFVAVHLLASGGKQTEASSVSRSAHMVGYPSPPMKAAIPAGIDLYSLDDLSVDTGPFVIGNVPSALRGTEQARRYATESVEAVSGELAVAYQAGEKGADR
jgi:hypothetical protein